MRLKMGNGKWKTTCRKIFLLCLSLTAYCLLLGCSQPVWETTDCIESRDVVKKFYSFHIGNEMKPSTENLKKREKYLSTELANKLSDRSETAEDYFTQTDDFPKAFRAGKCESIGSNKTKFEVLLFWQNDETNIQRAIEVEAAKENKRWLINKVSSKK